jgi:hypothetical protein
MLLSFAESSSLGWAFGIVCVLDAMLSLIFKAAGAVDAGAEVGIGGIEDKPAVLSMCGTDGSLGSMYASC